MHAVIRKFQRAASRLRQGEDGFSMVVTMLAIMMLTATALVSLQGVDADQPIARTDLQRKGAYSAAEAGLQAYMHRLTVDSSYWSLCTGNNPGGTTVNGNNQTDAVNQWWNGSGTDPRKWANLPDNSGQYTVEELPANNKTKCDTNDPVGTMIDDDTATFRIRVTGRSLDAKLNPTSSKRSILATFKRKSFLDYIYFTDLEVLDPTLYPSRFAPTATRTLENPGNNDIDADGHQRSIDEWGNEVCAQYDYTKAKNNKYRDQQSFTGSSNRNAGQLVSGRWSSLTATCTDRSNINNAAIRFATDDVVEGPFHTNDAPLICGSPNFGRSPSDAIEVSAPGNPSDTTLSDSWRQDTASGCGSSAPDVNFNGSTAKSTLGSWLINQPVIQLPPSNQSLADDAPASYTFVGNTKIVLNGGNFIVTGKRLSDGAVLTNQTLPFPTDGVIYVQNDPNQGCTGYQVSDPYASRPGCGIATVSGKYTASLTIGTADDIILGGNILNQGGGKALLGLIAQNFIRVMHQIDSHGNNIMSGSLSNPEIDAALLTLKHSFLVDNWGDGDPLGTLKVVGAISQKFRGPVGTGSGRTSTSGYLKDYQYDDRLRTLSPPKFLDPVKASWRLKMFQEQSPAT